MPIQREISVSDNIAAKQSQFFRLASFILPSGGGPSQRETPLPPGASTVFVVFLQNLDPPMQKHVDQVRQFSTPASRNATNPSERRTQPRKTRQSPRLPASVMFPASPP